MNMLSAVTSYQAITRNLTSSLARVSNEPQIKREIEYYRANIGKIKSVDDFMADRRIYNFALTAFGMKDLIYAKGMIRKVLNDGTDDPAAFSVRMADQRFREFAEVFNFKRHASATTAFDRAQEGTIDRFVRGTLEEKSGAENEAVRLALYFDRKAPQLLNEFSILADKAIYSVVRTALGLPDSIAGSDIDKQAKLISKKLNIADFNDPIKREKFIRKFLSLNEAKVGSTSGSPAAELLGGRSPSVDINTMLSIQNLRKFGS